MRKISEKGEREEGGQRNELLTWWCQKEYSWKRTFSEREQDAGKNWLYSHISEVATTGLDGLDEEATGSGVAVYSTDEILHWWLMGKINEVTHMVDNQPGQMFGVVEVLTLNILEENASKNNILPNQNIFNELLLRCLNFYS